MSGKQHSSSRPSVGNRILQGLREFTDALEKGEELTEKFTCRQVTLDLTPAAYDPPLVRKTRDALGMSQALFAKFLGVGTKTVQAWEQGLNVPNPMACRFMDEIRLQPTYWQKRLKESTRQKSAARSE